MAGHTCRVRQVGSQVWTSRSTVGSNQELTLRAKEMPKIDEDSPVPLSQTARRPVAKVFRGIKGVLEHFEEVRAAAGAMEMGAPTSRASTSSRCIP